MAFPGDLFSMAADGAGAVLDLYGAGAADRYNRRLMQKQHDLAIQYDSTAIQRRVADAEKAGVHPLFALGASPSQGPSLSVVPSEKGEAYRSVARSIGNRLTPVQRALEIAQLEEIKSRTAKNIIDANWAASEQARLKRESESTGPAPPGMIDSTGSREVSARVGDPTAEAGGGPFWKEHDFLRMEPFKKIWLPGGSSPSEGMESITESIPVMLMTYFKNVYEAGQRHGKRLKARGRHPKQWFK